MKTETKKNIMCVMCRPMLLRDAAQLIYKLKRDEQKIISEREEIILEEIFRLN
jgi:hypothetical protein